MNRMVFDTETVNLDKPFCYNVGYVIANDRNEILCSRDFVIEQIWHNPELFSTAYYTEKRKIYIERMRAKAAIMDKFGYVCQKMIRDIKNFEVEKAFAFNSSFDERVFNFNCEWFKCNNPFDNIPISDIRGFAHEFIVDDSYKNFCDLHELFTENGNYATTAESFYKYLFDCNFEEEHTALADSVIENEILQYCIDRGADINEDYKAKKSIERRYKKTLTLTTMDKEKIFFDYYKMTISKDKTKIKLN